MIARSLLLLAAYCYCRIVGNSPAGLSRSFCGSLHNTRLIFTSSSSFDAARFSLTSTSCSHAFHVSSNFAGLAPIPDCNTACNIANLRPAVVGAFSATNCLQTSNPFRFRTRCTSLKLRHVVSVANKAHSVWLKVRMSTEASSVPAGTHATGCDSASCRSCTYLSFTNVRQLPSLKRNSSQVLSSFSYGRSCSKPQDVCKVRRH